MIPRRAARLVRSRLRDYPAVALVGPRQCGKTTLARATGGSYFDLEQPVDRLKLDLQWDALVAGKRLVILDEAQTWPELFPRLRGAIDAQRKRNGRFLLLGSVSPALMTHVSESLAGRLSLVELTPLLWTELENRTQQKRLWLSGGYPDGGVLNGRGFPRWQLDYLTLLAQRDLPAWGLPARPQATERLLRMMAAGHAQLLNASQIGQGLGISYHTVNSYLDYLEGAFLLRRLPPYLPNLRKRLVRSPKIYWRDTGLLHALLGATDQERLLSQPWVGASWEGFVVQQILGTLEAVGRPHSAFHFRTSDQREIDLVLELDAQVWAIEVKLTSSPAQADLHRLDEAADLISAHRRFLVCQIAKPAAGSGRAVCGLEYLLQKLSAPGAL